MIKKLIETQKNVPYSKAPLGKTSHSSSLIGSVIPEPNAAVKRLAMSVTCGYHSKTTRQQREREAEHKKEQFPGNPAQLMNPFVTSGKVCQQRSDTETTAREKKKQAHTEHNKSTVIMKLESAGVFSISARSHREPLTSRFFPLKLHSSLLPAGVPHVSWMGGDKTKQNRKSHAWFFVNRGSEAWNGNKQQRPKGNTWTARVSRGFNSHVLPTESTESATVRVL